MELVIYILTDIACSEGGTRFEVSLFSILLPSALVVLSIGEGEDAIAVVLGLEPLSVVDAVATGVVVDTLT